MDDSIWKKWKRIEWKYQLIFSVIFLFLEFSKVKKKHTKPFDTII